MWSRDRTGRCEAAREHLEAGFPIYYSKPDTPPDLIIREHPDGRCELVRIDLSTGEPEVIGPA